MCKPGAEGACAGLGHGRATLLPRRQADRAAASRPLPVPEALLVMRQSGGSPSEPPPTVNDATSGCVLRVSVARD